MVEVDYSTPGYNIMSHLGKGKAILGLLVSGVATGETITTPFARCIPVVTPNTGTPNIDATVTESAGVVTFNGTATSTAYNVIILGDLY